LSYTPAKGNVKIKNIRADVKFCFAAFWRFLPETGEQPDIY